MPRKPEHGQIQKRKCKCGATFKTERALRRHLLVEDQGERVVWIATPVPVNPRKATKKLR